jgi:hypothetical protein
MAYRKEFTGAGSRRKSRAMLFFLDWRCPNWPHSFLRWRPTKIVWPSVHKHPSMITHVTELSAPTPAHIPNRALRELRHAYLTEPLRAKRTLQTMAHRGMGQGYFRLREGVRVCCGDASRFVSFDKVLGSEPGCADVWACDSNHARNASSKGLSAFSSGQVK